jgi:hypothetical protein
MLVAAVVAVQVRALLQQPVVVVVVTGLELAWQVSAQQQAGLDNQRAVPMVGQVLPGAEQSRNFMAQAAVAVQRLVWRPYRAITCWVGQRAALLVAGLQFLERKPLVQLQGPLWFQATQTARSLTSPEERLAAGMALME